MRKLHTFEEEALASRFTAILTVNKIEAQVLRNNESGWDLWIVDEDSMQAGLTLLERFQDEPDADEFKDAFAQAKLIHQQIKQEKAERLKRAKTIEVRTQFRDPRHINATLRRKNTFTRKIIVACAVVFGASLVFTSDNNQEQGKNFVRNALEVLDRSRVENPNAIIDGERVFNTEREWKFQHIAEGQVWRLITPVFVHGADDSFFSSFIHIFFNMYWLYWLGTLIEIRFGLKTYLTLFFVSAIASVLIPLLVPSAGLFGLPGLGGAPVVGMSGVVYAVIGFGWCKMRLQPSVGMLVPPFILILSLIYLFYGAFIATGSDHISHLAHLTGMVVGSLIAYFHTRLGK